MVKIRRSPQALRKFSTVFGNDVSTFSLMKSRKVLCFISCFMSRQWMCNHYRSICRAELTSNYLLFKTKKGENQQPCINLPYILWCLNLSKSFCTSLAALVPSSIAPSMKLLHPTAQSELAKNTLPCLARSDSRYVVTNSVPGKNQAPLAYLSSDQLWKTYRGIFVSF